MSLRRQALASPDGDAKGPRKLVVATVACLGRASGDFSDESLVQIDRLGSKSIGGAVPFILSLAGASWCDPGQMPSR